MKSKLLYLKKCQMILRDRIARERLDLELGITPEYVETVRMFLHSNYQQGELWIPLENKTQGQAIDIFEFERDRYVIERQ
jgi:hypothetical protein